MLASMESMADDPSVGKVEIVALQALAAESRPTMTRLAEATGIRLSTATKIVDRLTEKKLVDRERNGGDRRVVRVMLTPLGAAAVATYQRQMRKTVAEMLAVLTPDEQDAFIRIWEKIADAADAPPRR